MGKSRSKSSSNSPNSIQWHDVPIEFHRSSQDLLATPPERRHREPSPTRPSTNNQPTSSRSDRFLRAFTNTSLSGLPFRNRDQHKSTANENQTPTSVAIAIALPPDFFEKPPEYEETHPFATTRPPADTAQPPFDWQSYYRQRLGSHQTPTQQVVSPSTPSSPHRRSSWSPLSPLSAVDPPSVDRHAPDRRLTTDALLPTHLRVPEARPR